MADFHEVRFPLRLSLSTSGGPVRRTDIVRLTNGREQRNQRWRDARRRYDAGSGVRTVDDLYALTSFFEARRGQLHGFRFQDPVDSRSSAPSGAVSATDQPIGVGDGERRSFQLVKVYGDAGGATVRTIAKPVEGSVIVAVGGEVVPEEGFTVDAVTGLVTFPPGSEPPAGAAVTAGFRFDVPVRFDIDRLDVNLTAFRAGQIPSVPLVEIMP